MPVHIGGAVFRAPTHSISAVLCYPDRVRPLLYPVFQDEAARALEILTEPGGRWRDLSAAELCRKYPALVAREFMVMLRDFLHWLAPTVEADETFAAQEADNGDGIADFQRESLPRQPQPQFYGVQRRDEAAAYRPDREAGEQEPPFRATDYIARVEWQKRGMPHAHILLWWRAAEAERAANRAGTAEEAAAEQPCAHDFGLRDDAPSDPEDTEKAPCATSVAGIMDKYVCTRSPARWRRTYGDAVMEHLSAALVHTHSAYCGRAITGVCRFGFPHPATRSSRAKTRPEMLASGSKSRMLVRRRPDGTMMGLYSATMLRRWRGSMDLQYCQDHRSRGSSSEPRRR